MSVQLASATSLDNQKLSGPFFVRFFGPVLDALRDLGASARPREVCDHIESKINLSDDYLALVNKNGASKFENHVAWARFHLAKSGYIEGGRYGIWNLSEKGREAHLTHQEALKIFRRVHSTFNSGDTAADDASAQTSEEKAEEQSQEHDTPDDNEYFNQEQIEEELTKILRSMSDKGFEEFCARLLRHYGLENVRVMGRSGDEGIDGVGDLMINKFVRTKVMFQCKRYSNPVPPKEIRDFRGALQGRAGQGIFLTTSTFTKSSKAEAARENAVPLELVDISSLVQLSIEGRLGLNERVALELDRTFFAPYLDRKEQV